MPERLGADKKQKIEQAHAELVAVLHERGVDLSEAEATRLRKKLAAYIGKTNPEHMDIPTLADAVAEKIGGAPQARARWFPKAGILHTLEEHARGNIRRAAELRRSIAERTDWTPVPAETSTADGRYYLAQLMSEGHLKEESAFLEHCLGASSLDYYLPRIKRGEIEIFSVRDSQTHEPVVTIEYDVKSKSVRQVKGRNNQRLTADSPYVKATVELLAFLKNRSVHHDRLDPQIGAPLRREVRAIADLDQLVKRTHSSSQAVTLSILRVSARLISRQLTSSSATFRCLPTTPPDLIARVAALPVNVDAAHSTPEQVLLLRTVGGNLFLSDTNIKQLPENLTVGGDLYLSGTKITELPENFSLGGGLFLSDTNITALPENLTVGGGLDLFGTNITALPENLTVGGDLDLSDTNIKQLPENLTVGGLLDLSDTRITALPENFTVGGGLCLSGTNIKQLPENLSVGGSLDLRRTKITVLSPSVSLPRRRPDLRPQGHKASREHLAFSTAISVYGIMRPSPISSAGERLQCCCRRPPVREKGGVFSCSCGISFSCCLSVSLCSFCSRSCWAHSPWTLCLWL